jgi:chemotaxis protein CheZ
MGTVMPNASTQQLNHILSYLRHKRSQEVTFSDLAGLAEVAVQSLQSFFDRLDASVYRELREIGGYIEAMKLEIADLQVNELTDKRIPAAGQELGAIVKATERATHDIMECAEALMEADPSDPAAYKALVDAKMLVIFEACSFQDLTGQRIAKVVETLEHIEARVASFASAVHADEVAGSLSERETAKRERQRRLLLHGPQAEGEGIGQNDIDRLFA